MYPFVLSPTELLCCATCIKEERIAKIKEAAEIVDARVRTRGKQREENTLI